MYYAHSLEDQTKNNWQTLRDHLLNVQAEAAVRGAKFGACKVAGLAGLLHDLGKYTEAFQKRLEDASVRVDHATAGAQKIHDLVSEPEDLFMAELLSYVIAGHHTGLPDMNRETGSLSERLKKKTESLDQIWKTELNPDASRLWPETFNLLKNNEPFQMAFLTRMIYSCLVDADFRDTERFYAVVRHDTIDRDWPKLSDEIDNLIAKLDGQLAGFCKEGKVNRLRYEILTHVRSQASRSPGIFSLNVPTGGGKTLTSLAFALDHAKTHGLERIVYAIPFTSIIDQTAVIFNKVLGDGVVLEHHSAIEEVNPKAQEGADKLRLAMEDWSAPIVVTTNVQLFESLFAHRPSRCRKLHNLARAVIILDEAQTIPLEVLRPSVAALNELARNYGSSIVLCTATQPALKTPDFAGGFDNVQELAPNPPNLHRALSRVTVARKGVLSNEDLLSALSQTEQGLVIVNSRRHALDLFNEGKEDIKGLIHLTTRQYAAHRLRILSNVRKRLDAGKPCRVIATSLIEAGVDLDFPRVWRAEAGLDSIAQAAGRCNREGRYDKADSLVIVFRPDKYPSPPELAQLAGDMQRIVDRHCDLLSPEAVKDYFQEVYWRKGTNLGDGVLCKFKADQHGTSFYFREVGETFRLIKSEFCPVIISIEENPGRALRDLVYSEGISGVARRLQPYIVQVPSYIREQLIRNNHVYFAAQERCGDQFAVLRSSGLYRDDTGLLWEDADILFDDII